VHVKLVGEDYRVEHVVQGDSIAEVLSYVQYQRDDLIARVRRAIEDAVREKRLTPAESGRLMRRYQEGLDGPTYLTAHD
jgi:arginine decarboxylase